MSINGNLDEQKFERLNLSYDLSLIELLGIRKKEFRSFLNIMIKYKIMCDEILLLIDSKEISRAHNEETANKLNMGVSVVGGAIDIGLALIPGMALARRITTPGMAIAKGIKTISAAKKVGSNISHKVKSYDREKNLMSYGLSDITKNSGSKTLIICIDGFLSEGGTEQFTDWNISFQTLNITHWRKGYRWPATTGSGLASSLFNNLGFSGWYEAIGNTAKAASRLLSDINFIYELNPNIKIILMGHSLGARVIYNTLLQADEKGIKVSEAYLFGGAVSRINKAGWMAALKAVDNKVYNFYSANDKILKNLYKGLMRNDEPIGLGEIKYFKNKNIKLCDLHNIDVTDQIDGHTKYKEKLPELLRLKQYNFGVL